MKGVLPSRLMYVLDEFMFGHENGDVFYISRFLMDLSEFHPVDISEWTESGEWLVANDFVERCTYTFVMYFL
jgi:hypothetical protein